MSRKVALDIGGKRTGIAITDSLNIIASGLTTVNTEQLITFLKDLFAKDDYDSIVIGKPMHLDGRPTDATPIVEQVSNKLKKEFTNYNFFFVDERFTSKLASQAILNSGAKKKTRRDKALVDKVSATIILQNFLQQQSL